MFLTKEEEELNKIAISLFGTDKTLPWFLDFNGELKIWKTGRIWNTEMVCLNIINKEINRTHSPFETNPIDPKDRLNKIADNQLKAIPAEEYLEKYFFFFKEHESREIALNVFEVAKIYNELIDFQGFDDLQKFEYEMGEYLSRPIF